MASTSKVGGDGRRKVMYHSASAALQAVLGDGNDSDGNLSDDDDFSIGQNSDQDVDAADAEDDDSDDVAVSQPVVKKGKAAKVIWKRKDFAKIDVEESIDESVDERQDWTPVQYFTKYLTDEFFETVAKCTNIRSVLQTGSSLNASSAEIMQFFGINLLTGCIRYPCLRMYWENATRLPQVADTMSRTRFFKLRSNLKVVDDNCTPDEIKDRDRLWKVRPLLELVRTRCLQLHRGMHLSVDEQIIPFTGRCSMKQFVRGKPNPEGIKNFVLASPQGLVLDFKVYTGQDIVKDVHDDVGFTSKVVISLSQTSPPNSVIYCDRYFTTVGLLAALHARDLYCTGTVMMNRINHEARLLKSDKMMKAAEHGNSDTVVSPDNSAALVKWFDNKAVHVLSSCSGANPMSKCRRWSKREKRYIEIDCPAAVVQYNKYMGGVDLSDRLIAYYRTNARTKKWTIRTIFHFTDLSISNAWLQYREDRRQLGDRKKEILDLFRFRYDVAMYLINAVKQDTSTSSNSSEEEQGPGRPIKRKVQPLPSQHKRFKQSLHMPEMISRDKFSPRCRLPGCTSRTTVRCQTCDVHLCLTAQRNCFTEFHKK